jgi:hypothetical protein
MVTTIVSPTVSSFASSFWDYRPPLPHPRESLTSPPYQSSTSTPPQGLLLAPTCPLPPPPPPPPPPPSPTSTAVEEARPVTTTQSKAAQPWWRRSVTPGFKGKSECIEHICARIKFHTCVDSVYTKTRC